MTSLDNKFAMVLCLRFPNLPSETAINSISCPDLTASDSGTVDASIPGFFPPKFELFSFQYISHGIRLRGQSKARPAPVGLIL